MAKKKRKSPLQQTIDAAIQAGSAGAVTAAVEAENSLRALNKSRPGPTRMRKESGKAGPTKKVMPLMKYDPPKGKKANVSGSHPAHKSMPRHAPKKPQSKPKNDPKESDLYNKTPDWLKWMHGGKHTRQEGAHNRKKLADAVTPKGADRANKGQKAINKALLTKKDYDKKFNAPKGPTRTKATVAADAKLKELNTQSSKKRKLQGGSTSGPEAGRRDKSGQLDQTARDKRMVELADGPKTMGVAEGTRNVGIANAAAADVAEQQSIQREWDAQIGEADYQAEQQRMRQTGAIEGAAAKVQERQQRAAAGNAQEQQAAGQEWDRQNRLYDHSQRTGLPFGVGTPGYEAETRAYMQGGQPAQPQQPPVPPGVGGRALPQGEWDARATKPGNIDVSNLPGVRNADGTVSSVRSMSIGVDGKQVLIPTVVNGRVVSDEEAIEHYRKTGNHLGEYASVEGADAASQALHEQEAKRVQPGVGGRTVPIAPGPDGMVTVGRRSAPQPAAQPADTMDGSRGSPDQTVMDIANRVRENRNENVTDGDLTAAGDRGTMQAIRERNRRMTGLKSDTEWDDSERQRMQGRLATSNYADENNMTVPQVQAQGQVNDAQAYMKEAGVNYDTRQAVGLEGSGGAIRDGNIGKGRGRDLDAKARAKLKFERYRRAGNHSHTLAELEAKEEQLEKNSAARFAKEDAQRDLTQELFTNRQSGTGPQNKGEYDQAKKAEAEAKAAEYKRDAPKRREQEKHDAAMKDAKRDRRNDRKDRRQGKKDREAAAAAAKAEQDRKDEQTAYERDQDAKKAAVAAEQEKYEREQTAKKDAAAKEERDLDRRMAAQKTQQQNKGWEEGSSKEFESIDREIAALHGHMKEIENASPMELEEGQVDPAIGQRIQIQKQIDAAKVRKQGIIAYERQAIKDPTKSFTPSYTTGEGTKAGRITAKQFNQMLRDGMKTGKIKNAQDLKKKLGIKD